MKAEKWRLLKKQINGHDFRMRYLTITKRVKFRFLNRMFGCLFEELQLCVPSLYIPNYLMMKRIIKKVGEDGATAREKRETNLTSRREADKEIKG